MNATLKAPCFPADISKHEDRVDLLIKAGEFTQAVSDIMEQHFIAETTDEGSPLGDRTIGGLLGAMNIVGSALLTLAEDASNELEAIKGEDDI